MVAVDPADLDADTAQIASIFLNGLRVATFFVAVGWLLRVVEVVADAHAELPDA